MDSVQEDAFYDEEGSINNGAEGRAQKRNPTGIRVRDTTRRAGKTGMKPSKGLAGTYMSEQKGSMKKKDQRSSTPEDKKKKKKDRGHIMSASGVGDL